MQYVTICGIAIKAMFKGKFSTLNLCFRQEYFIKYCLKDNGSTEEKNNQFSPWSAVWELFCGESALCQNCVV